MKAGISTLSDLADGAAALGGVMAAGGNHYYCDPVNGSDGNDGPTDAAGGSADLESWRRIQNEGIPYQELLEDNDSYHLLERSGNLIKVPPTRNNVMDVHIFLRGGNP